MPQLVARFVFVCAAACVFCVAPAGELWAAPLYTDVTSSTGLSFHNTRGPALPGVPLQYDVMARNVGSGAAVGDYDGDGDLDVYMLGAWGYSNKLFRNNYPSKTFTDVTTSPLDDTGLSRVAHFADLDNDGDPDLLLVNDDDGVTTPRSKIFRNDGGTFTDVSVGSGFRPIGYLHSGVALADYDLDGLLDIYVTVWTGGYLGGHNRLYRNLGNCTFQDVTTSVGLSAIEVFSFGAIFTDVSGDHHPDLLVAVDGGSDYYLENSGGTFSDATSSSHANHFGNDMGIAVADYDDDGDLDYYLTNITDPSGFHGTGTYNVFYENQWDAMGMVSFIDRATALGVQDTYWGWGTQFVDVEQDGDLDLIAVTGFDEFVLDTTGTNSPVYQTPSVLFVKNGSTYSRVLGAGLDDPDDSRALIAFDYDRDGDQDLLITNMDQPARFLENVSTNKGHWLNVKLQPDCKALGAAVYATTGGTTRRRDVVAGRSYMAGTPPEAHFGLGFATTVDQLRVVWADGKETVLTNVAADRTITISTPLSVPAASSWGYAVLATVLLLTTSWAVTRRARRSSCSARRATDCASGRR